MKVFKSFIKTVSFPHIKHLLVLDSLKQKILLLLTTANNNATSWMKSYLPSFIIKSINKF